MAHAASRSRTHTADRAVGATQDALHTRLTSVLVDVRHSLGPVEIVDLTLVARYYERLADHAVAIARAVSYLVTGRHAALAE